MTTCKIEVNNLSMCSRNYLGRTHDRFSLVCQGRYTVFDFKIDFKNDEDKNNCMYVRASMQISF